MILIINALYFTLVVNNNNTNIIEKEIQGIRLSKDTLEILEKVTLNINGSIEKYDNGFSFEGELYISNLEYTKGKNILLIYDKRYGENRFIDSGIISYDRNIIVNDKVIPDFATVHWVNTDLNLSHLVMANYDDCINNPSEDSIRVYSGNDILVFPATDTETALKVIKELKIDQGIFKKRSFEDNINNSSEVITD